jgi:hypothetical protein
MNKRASRGHHGRSIGQHHPARWPARLRRVQAREGTQAPHPGGYPGAHDRPPSRARQYVGPTCGGSSAGWPGSFVSTDPYGDCRLARDLIRQEGWKLQIVKRRQRAFQIRGLTWIVERSFAWLGRNRRFSKDYEYRVQTSETLLDIAATRFILNRLVPA